MLIYDITKNPSVFPKEKQLWSGTTIRAVTTKDGVVSALAGIHEKEGVHLILFSNPGFSVETSYNSVHHHISILSENPVPYAEVFGTKKFIIYSVKNKNVEFLKARFPSWDYVGLHNFDIPKFELNIP